MPAPIVTVAGGVRFEARPVRNGITLAVQVELFDVAHEERLTASGNYPLPLCRDLARENTIIVTDDELADLNLWAARIGVAFTAEKHALEEQLAADEARRMTVRRAA